MPRRGWVGVSRTLALLTITGFTNRAELETVYDIEPNIAATELGAQENVRCGGVSVESDVQKC
jgi:hypothetical protein